MLSDASICQTEKDWLGNNNPHLDCCSIPQAFSIVFTCIYPIRIVLGDNDIVSANRWLAGILLSTLLSSGSSYPMNRGNSPYSVHSRSVFRFQSIFYVLYRIFHLNTRIIRRRFQKHRLLGCEVPKKGGRGVLGLYLETNRPRFCLTVGISEVSTSRAVSCGANHLELDERLYQTAIWCGNNGVAETVYCEAVLIVG